MAAAENKQWTYVVKAGDTLSEISERIYGAHKRELVNYLFENCYTYKGNPPKRGKSHLYPGDEITVRDILRIVFKKASYETEHDCGLLVPTGCFKSNKAVRFYYGSEEKEDANKDDKSTEKKKGLFDDEIMRRRFIYCWEKKGDEYINHGVFMTDDWGQPWEIDTYLKKGKKLIIKDLNNEDIFLKPLREDFADSKSLKGILYPKRVEYWYRQSKRAGNAKFMEPESVEKSRGTYNRKPLYLTSERLKNMGEKLRMDRDFAFYSPEEIKNIKFYLSTDQNIYYHYRAKKEGTYKNVSMLESQSMDARVLLKPGREYIFRLAPLDTIRGRDGVYDINGGMEQYDPMGIENPAQYRTKIDWDVKKLVKDGLATPVVISQPEVLQDTYYHKAVKIKLTPNLPEYISLIKKYTNFLQEGLEQFGMAKVPYSVVYGKLDQLSLLTTLMEHFPTDSVDEYLLKEEKVLNLKPGVKDLKLYDKEGVRRKIKKEYQNFREEIEKLKKGIEDAMEKMGNADLKEKNKNKSADTVNINVEKIGFNERESGEDVTGRRKFPTIMGYVQEKLDSCLLTNIQGDIDGIEKKKSLNIFNEENMLDHEKFVYDHMPRETIDFMPLTERGEKLLKIIEDPDFANLLDDYLKKELAVKENSDPESQLKDFYEIETDYFSFKHPIGTIFDAIKEAYVALLSIPDKKFVNEFRKKHVEPFGQALVKEYDSDEKLPPVADDLLHDFIYIATSSGTHSPKKQSTVTAMEAERKRLNEIFTNIQEEKYSGSMANVKEEKPGALLVIWNYTKDKTHWINNQEGAASYYSVLVEWFTDFSEMISENASLISGKLKEYLKKHLLMISKVYGKTKEFRELVGSFVKYFADKMPYKVNMEKLRIFSKGYIQSSAQSITTTMNKFDKKNIPVYGGYLMSGIQLCASVLVLFTFLAKPSRDMDDWAECMGAFSNGALALTGFNFGKILNNYKKIESLKFLDKQVHLKKITTTKPRHANYETHVKLPDGKGVRNLTRKECMINGLGKTFQICSNASSLWISQNKLRESSAHHRSGRSLLYTAILAQGILNTAYWMELTKLSIPNGAIFKPLPSIVRANYIWTIVAIILEKYLDESDEGTYKYFNALFDSLIDDPLFCDEYKFYAVEEKNMSVLTQVNEEEKMDNYGPLIMEIVRCFHMKPLTRVKEGPTKKILKKMKDMSLRFYPIDPEFCVYKLVELGWDEAGVQQLLNDGYFVREDDTKVKEIVSKEYKKWTRILEKDTNGEYKHGDSEYEELKAIRQLFLNLDGSKEALEFFNEHPELLPKIV
ncbi:MAG: LysM peptidoglycan-binding domain-containing protein [bacterium]|nr:LysM peptidoglycan-binding domain-containing protein [bacterium]